MTSQVKNIIIFAIIGVIFISIYIFFIKKAPEPSALVSTSSNSVVLPSDSSNQDFAMNKDFLSLLLNVKNIKLDDAIFSDIAFNTLRDSSIVLIPDGTEGRINPFAPIGSENALLPVNNINNARVKSN